MIVAGIDPGATGGIALIESTTGMMMGACRMPVFKDGKHAVSVTLAAETLASAKVIVLEAVHSMPRQGVASSFQFGRMVGMIEATAMMLKVPLHKVTPSVWKAHHNLSKDKRASLARCSVLYPGMRDWNVLANEGMAEAALIAQWFIDKRK